MAAPLTLRRRIFLLCAALALAVVAAIAAGLAFAHWRGGPGGAASGYVTAGLAAGFAALGLVTAAWHWLDDALARPVDRLAGELRARVHARVDRPLRVADGGENLGDLVPAAEALLARLEEARDDIARKVEAETARTRTDRDRLTALLSDMPAGLLLCAPDHQLVFYNQPAVELLEKTGRPHLDRPVFELLREAPIRQSYARLLASPPGHQDTEMLLSTQTCGRLLAGHMRLVSGALGLGATPGYLLTLRDVTADLARHRERERLLTEMMAEIRPPAGTLRTLLEIDAETASQGGSDPDVALAIRGEAAKLAETVSRLAERYDRSLTSFWPKQDVSAADFIDGLRAQQTSQGPELDAPPPQRMLRVDVISLIALIARVLDEVGASGLARTVSLRFDPGSEAAETILVLSWPGEPLRLETLAALLAEPLKDAPGDITGREALDHHGTDLWSETDGTGRAALILPLHETRAAEAGAPRRRLAERPVVFDFDLLARSGGTGMAGRPLNQLSYVVFDTETTGLDPSGGDEICQIAALRLANGRLVEGEVFDTLVDPGRPIPARASAVHGITGEAVRGAPDIAEAGADFARFAKDAVLVAHNAPFDMAFLRRHADAIGDPFEHPVFDTVILSALLFGEGESHTLDALATRFGIVIPDEARHTAYGDAIATAEVFERMLPMLAAKGLATYDDVLAEMQRDTRLMREMTSRVGA